MPENYWIGLATAVAQVTTIAITAYDATTTYKITVGGQVISVIGSGGTTTTVATALAAAWNASTHAYCKGVTAVPSTNTVTLTADTAGVPFVVSSSVSGGTGTIGAATAATANAGPNDWSTAANWSLGTVPVNGDNVSIRNSIVPILWGLAQTGVAPALVLIESNFTGTIGLPYNKFTTAAGTYDATAPEYRQSYLAIAATAVRVGESLSSQQGSGSTLIKIDTSTANVAVNVFSSGNSADNLPPVRLKMNHASATLNLYGNSKVGLCFETPAESGQVATVQAFPGGNGSPEISIGANVTQATHLQVAGSGLLRNAPTTAKVESGARLSLAGPGAGGGGTITTLEKRGDLVMTGTYTVTNLKG